MTGKASLKRIGPLAAMLASACTVVGPDYIPPETSIAGSYQEAGPRFREESADLSGWWTRFGDPQLDALIDRAARGNLDVAEAVLRIQEARALRGAAAAEALPSMDARTSFRRTQDSENTSFGQFRTIRTSEIWDLGFDASWEIDLFGRVARQVEASDAEIEGLVASARDALVSLYGECALQYVDLCTARERMRIARENIRIQERTLSIARARYEAGLVSQSDVEQATANLANTRARIPDLEVAERVAENRIAVLLGLQPGALAEELRPGRGIPVPPATIATGMPADLIRRRPDIRRAEREIARQTALIGAIEAELYPRIILSGSFGVESELLENLPKGSSVGFGFGPSIAWNLFDGGRTRRRMEAQDSRREQALLRFDATLLRAVEEVENAMTAFVRRQAHREILREGMLSARRAVELAAVQYEQGLSDFQVVLESERTLADFEDRLALVEGEISRHAVSLFKALGGGPPEIPPAE